MGGGAKREAEAKQNIAKAQLAQAERERQYSLSRAEVSSSELENQRVLNQIRDQVVGQGQREIEFLQKGLDLREPGASAFGQGLYSSILLRQREAQKQMLESQLRQRFGAGYATSSAGMAALNQFQQQTADLATQMLPSVLQAQAAATTGAASYEDMLKKRQIAASQGASTTPYQGASEIYNLEMARNNQRLWSGGLTLAGGAIGASIGGPAGGVLGAQLGGATGGGSGSGGNEWWNLPTSFKGGGSQGGVQSGQFGNLITPPTNQGWQSGFGFGNMASQLPTGLSF